MKNQINKLSIVTAFCVSLFGVQSNALAWNYNPDGSFQLTDADYQTVRTCKAASAVTTFDGNIGNSPRLSDPAVLMSFYLKEHSCDYYAEQIRVLDFRRANSGGVGDRKLAWCFCDEWESTKVLKAEPAEKLMEHVNNTLINGFKNTGNELLANLQNDRDFISKVAEAIEAARKNSEKK